MKTKFFLFSASADNCTKTITRPLPTWIDENNLESFRNSVQNCYYDVLKSYVAITDDEYNELQELSDIISTLDEESKEYKRFVSLSKKDKLADDINEYIEYMDDLSANDFDYNTYNRVHVAYAYGMLDNIMSYAELPTILGLSKCYDLSYELSLAGSNWTPTEVGNYNYLCKKLADIHNHFFGDVKDLHKVNNRYMRAYLNEFTHGFKPTSNGKMKTRGINNMKVYVRHLILFYLVSFHGIPCECTKYADKKKVSRKVTLNL